MNALPDRGAIGDLLIERLQRETPRLCEDWRRPTHHCVIIAKSHNDLAKSSADTFPQTDCTARHAKIAPGPTGVSNLVQRALLCLCIAAWPLLARPQAAETPAPQAPPAADDKPVELDPVTVTGKRTYLYESDRALERLKKNLPEFGGDKAPVTEGLVDAVAEGVKEYYQANKDPNTMKPDQQEMLLKTSGETADEHLP